MPHLALPRFPRGFLLSERPVTPPPQFIRGPLLSNFWVHPWTPISVAGDKALFVIVIGHLVPTKSTQGLEPTSDLLAMLAEGEGRFLEALGEYGGRHAIIFGSERNIRVVNDATGMRSVFYAAEGGLVASHALLVEQALGGAIVRDELPIQYGYPGNRTPYRRTKVLTANTYYWMTANVVRRFWPLAELTPRTVDEAAIELLNRSVQALRFIAQGRKVQLTLTAGLDSRAIFAITKHAGVPFQTYTYGDNKITTVDRLLSEELACRYGVEHRVIKVRSENDELYDRLGEANYLDHHGAWVEALRALYSDPNTLGVLGNTLEIGRSNTMSQRRFEDRMPITAQGMAQLYYRRIPARKRRQIDDFGYEHFMAKSIEAFAGFIADTGYDLVAGWLNPFDLFYWESRMSTWQGLAMNERDFYSVPFIPFNTRSVFEAMLGVPDEQRYADQIVYRMIEMVDSSLLELPVNPKRWTRKPSMAMR